MFTGTSAEEAVGVSDLPQWPQQRLSGGSTSLAAAPLWLQCMVFGSGSPIGQWRSRTRQPKDCDPARSSLSALCVGIQMVVSLA